MLTAALAMLAAQGEPIDESRYEIKPPKPTPPHGRLPAPLPARKREPAPKVERTGPSREEARRMRQDARNAAKAAKRQQLKGHQGEP
jgi:hypothetical protein